MISKEEYLEIENVMTNGGGNHTDEQLKKINRNAQILENELYNEVMQGDFNMLYQPKVESDGVTMKSAEALFRTNREYFINPEVAFGLFKLAKHENDVLNKQIERICTDTKKLADKFGSDFHVSVNVALDLLDLNFCRNLDYQLQANGLSYKNIDIEILEGENFDHIKDHAKVINFLKSQGVKFALDDFGSKNANENALNSMEFDIVKIDKDITKKARTSGNYNEIAGIYNGVKSGNEDAVVVVEGVETAEDVKALKQIGDMTYQGYYFGKPMTVSDVIKNFSSKTLEP